MTTRYLDLWNAKGLGDFKDDRSSIRILSASTVWVCLYRVRTSQLQSRSLYNDLKVRQIKTTDFWRVSHFIPSPLTFLNKCLDKLSVCAQHRNENFFLRTVSHAIHTLYDGQSKERSENKNSFLMPKTLPKEINRPFIFTAQKLFVSKYLRSKFFSLYRNKLKSETKSLGLCQFK